MVASVIDLDAASFQLQWASGGLLFLWVTTRRREVSLGYGWLMRATYALFAAGAAVVAFLWLEVVWVRELASIGVALAATYALVVSVQRRKVGVSGQVALAEARSARVAAMTGIEREAAEKAEGAEFPPNIDLIAPAIGFVGVVAAGLHAGDPAWLSVLRMVVGALFLGCITDAMLLGHWYLVQPGLARGALLELVRWCGWLVVPQIIVFLIPTGMISVLDGTIDDGWNGLLAWFWVACAVTTAGLIVVTRMALKERAYSAVMAATELLYLEIGRAHV